MRQLTTAFDQCPHAPQGRPWTRSMIAAFTLGVACQPGWRAARPRQEVDGSGGANFTVRGLASTHLGTPADAAFLFLLPICPAPQPALGRSSALVAVPAEAVTLTLPVCAPLALVIWLKLLGTLSHWPTRPYMSALVQCLLARHSCVSSSFLSLVTPHGQHQTMGHPRATAWRPSPSLLLAQPCIASVPLSARCDGHVRGLPVLAGFGTVCAHLAVPNVHVDHNGDTLRSVCSALRTCASGCGRTFSWARSASLSRAFVSCFRWGLLPRPERQSSVHLFGDAAGIVLPTAMCVVLYAPGLMGGLMGRKMASMEPRHGNEGASSGARQRPSTLVTLTGVGAGIITCGLYFDVGMPSSRCFSVLRPGLCCQPGVSRDRPARAWEANPAHTQMLLLYGRERCDMGRTGLAEFGQHSHPN